MSDARGEMGNIPGDDAQNFGEPIDDGIAVGIPPEDFSLHLSPEAPTHLDLAPEGVIGEESDPAKERDGYLDALQRLQADFENYKKRVTRLQEEQSTRAARDLVAKILPVLDTLDLGLAHGGDAGSGALEQTRVQLLEVLSKAGLERIDMVAVPFDPLIHDAVAHDPAETEDDGESLDDQDGDPNGVIVEEVLRAGYLWGGTILRPAMVRVRG